MKESDRLLTPQKTSKKPWPIQIFFVSLSIIYLLEAVAAIVFSVTGRASSATVPIFQSQLPYSQKIADFHIIWAGVVYFLVCSATSVASYLLSASTLQVRNAIFIGHGIGQGIIYSLLTIQTKQLFLESMIANGVLAFGQLAAVDDNFPVSTILGLSVWALLLWDYALLQNVAVSGDYTQSIIWIAVFGWAFFMIVLLFEQLRVLSKNSEKSIFILASLFFVVNTILVFLGIVQLGWHYTE